MRIFITGIVGTLGGAIALLLRDRGDTVIGCSRNEERAIAWRKGHEGIINHVANAGSKEMLRLMDTCDRVYHCAALKHVSIAEESPLEAWRQNVVLTADIANDRTVFASSDKACGGGGMGIYGATKLTAERIVLQAGGAVVRFGNLIGSSGSVFALWKAAAERGEPVRLTHPQMTRYFMSVTKAARFLADMAVPGAVVIPEVLKAAVMGEVANAVGGPNVEVVGLRAGETLHQWLVAPGERYAVRPGRLVLGGDGDVSEAGLCSRDATRWDVGELLSLAGIGGAN